MFEASSASDNHDPIWLIWFLFLGITFFVRLFIVFLCCMVFFVQCEYHLLEIRSYGANEVSLDRLGDGR
jgi:hypothetical protein